MIVCMITQAQATAKVHLHVISELSHDSLYSKWHNTELDNIHLVDVDVLIEEFVSKNEKRAFIFGKW